MYLLEIRSRDDDYETRMAPLLLYHLIPCQFRFPRKFPFLDTLITDGHLQANVSSPELQDEWKLSGVLEHVPDQCVGHGQPLIFPRLRVH